MLEQYRRYEAVAVERGEAQDQRVAARARRGDADEAARAGHLEVPPGIAEEERRVVGDRGGEPQQGCEPDEDGEDAVFAEARADRGAAAGVLIGAQTLPLRLT
ncbi:MAG: hypothetical protein NVSMB25_23520 [Thermoleophilaceae bacterium]